MMKLLHQSAPLFMPSGASIWFPLTCLVLSYRILAAHMLHASVEPGMVLCHPLPVRKKCILSTQFQ